MAAARPTRMDGRRSKQTRTPSKADDSASRQRGPGEAGALHLHDPRDIRALAHPARMAIIDALASGAELTATECAELTGLTPSATAYHLNLLERYDLAEPAPARHDGREKPWRASNRRSEFNLDTSTPTGATAAASVARAFFDRSRAVGETFMAAVQQEPKEWQDAAALNNTDLWLTAEETVELTAALAALLDPYRDRTLANRPDGTRRVRVMNVTVPHSTRRGRRPT